MLLILKANQAKRNFMMEMVKESCDGPVTTKGHNDKASYISKSQNIVFVLIIEVAYITAGNIYSNNLLLKLSSSVNSYKQH